MIADHLLALHAQNEQVFAEENADPDFWRGLYGDLMEAEDRGDLSVLFAAVRRLVWMEKRRHDPV